MPHWKYGFRIPKEKETVMVKASLREVKISPKDSMEVCREIRGMMLEEARRYMEDVVSKKRSVPYKRYMSDIGHRRDIEGWASGRYPVKTAKHILRLLDNLENNAEFKGLDTSRLRIVHSSSQRGMKLKNYVPRALGGSSPSFDTFVHVELVAEEV